MPSSLLQSAGLVLVSCASYIIFRSYVGRKSHLPPGPRGLPVVGNLYSLPKAYEWLVFIEMSRKYNSDIISLNVMGGTIIVLNSAASVDALLEDKSAIYSDRPSSTMLNDFVGFDWHFVFMRYGPRWKNHRKAFVQQFQPSQVLFHRPTELDAARVMLQRLLESPAKFERHLRHMTGMVILSTAYGIDIKPENDPYIDISEQAHIAISRTAKRGAYLVDFFPSLKYIPEFLPGGGFKKEAREWNKAVSAMVEMPYAFVKTSLTAGTAKSSIASRALEEIEGAPDAEEQEIVLKEILGSCYSGGSDTIVSALSTFILAMTLYPDIQKKAQAAVDAVVGRDRLPDFNDNIPYVDAVVREVLRWRPVLPLSIPHAVTQDDIYNGFHIPAGATVLGNSWAILHDEAIFGPNTDEFIPERWLTEDGEINTEMRNPGVAFGFGRRVCPGKDMAQRSVWICAASILAVFNINNSVDKNGVPIEPSGEYTSGVLSYPVPHKCDIVPRSETARAMIRSAVHD